MSLTTVIGTIIDDAINRRVFPGAVVLVAQGGKVVHHAAYGSTMYEDVGTFPVALDTIYDIASLTKMFTATATLHLIEQGLLALDTPVQAYLPQFCSPDVTIWHLLTHTSGIDIRLSTLRELGRAKLLDVVYASMPQRLPGSVVAYTNVNSLLLGEIVALLHGATLDAAIDELITAPLGLRDTGFCPPTRLLPRIAPTEVDDTWRGGLVHATVHDESAHALGGVAGHAGLFSTAEDVYQFCKAWLNSAFSFQPSAFSLQPSLARLATTNQTPGLNVACGLGWMLDRPNFMGQVPAGSFGHTGFTGPAMVVIPKRDVVVVVLSNRVYPRRGPPTHHPVIAAIVAAALANERRSG